MLEYIKYRWNAKGRHGTHSPFIYDFVDKCLRIPIDVDFEKERAALFNSLKKDKQSIQVADHGAGSKKLSSNREVRQLFSTSSSHGKYADLLFKLTKYYKPKRILEFGTSLGIGSMHLYKGYPETELITVEACTETRAVALKNFQRMGCENITSISARFLEFLDSYNGLPFDMVFIDGHHDGDALKQYLVLLEPITHNDTLFILDDIRWSNSMFHAWKEIIANKKYHVSIDLFRMGIILPRKQQVKEHFIVKL